MFVPRLPRTALRLRAAPGLRVALRRPALAAASTVTGARVGSAARPQRLLSTGAQATTTAGTFKLASERYGGGASPAPSAGTVRSLPHTAYLALGSNMGNRARNIQSALKALRSNPHIAVSDTSFLYETAPQGVTDQPLFLNAACKVHTALAPAQLLDALKEIERTLGRAAPGPQTVRNGPRPIDVDILLYNDVVSWDERLTIPHPRLHERDFVLAPLQDIAGDVSHPQLKQSIAALYAALPSTEPIYRVTPLALSGESDADSVVSFGHRTYVMGILNTTPDSFSDGGKYTALDAAVKRARQLVAEGCDWIDIGGQSTRPGAAPVPLATEVSRVVPVIQALRLNSVDVPISVDTYRSEVARAAVQAGANVVNDISGGLFDSQMLPTVARLGVPYVLMHTRGTPQTMALPEHTAYTDVVAEVRAALEARARAALDAGICRWNLIADPGIGFAKTAQHSLALIRNLQAVRPYELPLLAGPSRKGFVGRIIQAAEGADEPDASDSESRRWGTAAAVTACISGGADVVRVHDAKPMFYVSTVSDAIFRRSAL